jgi:hypothetical protein
VSERGDRNEHEHELQVLAMRARTLLDAAAIADLEEAAPGAVWHSEVAAWRDRYQAYLEEEAGRR